MGFAYKKLYDGNLHILGIDHGFVSVSDLSQVTVDREPAFVELFCQEVNRPFDEEKTFFVKLRDNVLQLSGRKPFQRSVNGFLKLLMKMSPDFVQLAVKFFLLNGWHLGGSIFFLVEGDGLPSAEEFVEKISRLFDLGDVDVDANEADEFPPLIVKVDHATFEATAVLGQRMVVIDAVTLREFLGLHQLTSEGGHRRANFSSCNVRVNTGDDGALRDGDIVKKNLAVMPHNLRKSGNEWQIWEQGWVDPFFFLHVYSPSTKIVDSELHVGVILVVLNKFVKPTNVLNNAK